MFRRQAQTDLRTRLVDDLLEAPASQRREMIDRAVKSGEVKKSEADELLRLVARLESVLRAETPGLAAVSPDSSGYAA